MLAIVCVLFEQLSVALDQAHKCNENGSDVCLPLSKDTTIIETMVINWNDVVTMSALAVDLSFATKGNISKISKLQFFFHLNLFMHHLYIVVFSSVLFLSYLVISHLSFMN